MRLCDCGFPLDAEGECERCGLACVNGTRGCGTDGNPRCGECQADLADYAYDRGRDEGWGA